VRWRSRPKPKVSERARRSVTARRAERVPGFLILMVTETVARVPAFGVESSFWRSPASAEQERLLCRVRRELWLGEQRRIRPRAVE